ncbi:SigE family RNA polymerase sigma factor [Catenulispora pinistramenti]|uniref:SigE family RNA polymerase sigma factor n=1 Tax=Catenulispora pinistramenti TaxID=2705254 RepID=UPI002E78C345|nr:SigE family RNA polymerase sigma factor [Catenulispora pinistramenti]
MGHDNERLRGFEEFVAARSQSLMRTAYLLVGNHEAAEDLVQSALEKAFPRWSRVRRMDTPEAYVRRIVVNDAHAVWRSAKRLPTVTLPLGPDASALVAAPVGHATDHADGVTLRDSLLRALDELPHGMRTIVVLRYWEELSVQEVADLLRCSTGNVKSQAARGLERLRELMTAEAVRSER